MAQASFLVKNGLGLNRSSVLGFDGDVSLRDIVTELCHKRNIEFSERFVDEWVLVKNGKRLNGSQNIQAEKLTTIELFSEGQGLLGGKGGYGSLLRNAAKAKIKLNDQNSNRTLSGRRIRDAENEKRMMEWLKREKRQRETIKKLSEEGEAVTKMEKKRKIDDGRMINEYTKKEQSLDSGSMSSSILQGISERKKVKTSDSFLPKFNREALPAKASEFSPKTKPAFQSEPQPGPESKKATVVVLDSPQEAVKPEFTALDFAKLKSLEDVKSVGGEHLKHELNRLGLKCGGTPDQRAERIWAVVQNPMLLSDPKLRAAPSKKNQCGF